MKKALKIIILVVVAVIAIGFILSNSKPKYEEAVAFPTIEFAKVYDKNPIKAESDYVGKRFFMSGRITYIGENMIELICSENELPYKKVRVELPVRKIDKKMKDKAAELFVGQIISVEGSLEKNSYVSFKKCTNCFGKIGMASGDITLYDIVFRDIPQ